MKVNAVDLNLKRLIRNPCLIYALYREIKQDGWLACKHKTTLLGEGRVDYRLPCKTIESPYSDVMK